MGVSGLLEKKIFTDDDFENISWHDNTIHAFSFNKENQLLFDIDFIFQWVHPKPGKRYFKFWISPCTLIFENVYNTIFDLEIYAPHDCKIDNISRSNPQRPKNADYISKELEHDWSIETLNGEISFKSVGYKLYVRQKPILVSTDELDIELRGGISFATTISN